MTCCRGYALLILLAFGMVFPDSARGYGALAIGLPEDVAEDGIAIGVSWNMPTPDTARSQALEQCLDFKTAPAKTRALCQVVRTYSRQCISVATDPEPGTEGWGWAVADSTSAAEMRSLRWCRSTMLQFCVITVAGCDASP